MQLAWYITKKACDDDVTIAVFMMVVGTHMWLGGLWFLSYFRWRESHRTELRNSPTISIDRWHRGEPNNGKITNYTHLHLPSPAHSEINIPNFRFQNKFLSSSRRYRICAGRSSATAVFG